MAGANSGGSLANSSINLPCPNKSGDRRRRVLPEEFWLRQIAAYIQKHRGRRSAATIPMLMVRVGKFTPKK